MTPQTTSDWLEALRLAGPALRQRKWETRSGAVRSESGQCPLCCLAELKSSDGAGYAEAWSMALAKSYGKDAALREAKPIAWAADHMNVDAPLQKALRTILRVPS